MAQTARRSRTLYVLLPARVRLLIAAVLLILATLASFDRFSPWLLALAAAVLGILGAFRFSPRRVFLLGVVSIPLLIGILVGGARQPFVRRYAGGFFYLVSAALFVDGIKLEEWLWFLRFKSLRSLRDVIISVAVAQLAVAQAITTEREARRLAKVGKWASNRRRLVKLKDRAWSLHVLAQSYLPKHEVPESCHFHLAQAGVGYQPLAPGAKSPRSL